MKTNLSMEKPEDRDQNAVSGSTPARAGADVPVRAALSGSARLRACASVYYLICSAFLPLATSGQAQSIQFINAAPSANADTENVATHRTILPLGITNPPFS